MNTKKNNTKLVTVIAIITGMLMSLNLFPQNTEQDPLYNATIRANVDGVKQALADGADINRQSDNGYTALMWAATYSSRSPYAEVAKFLINAGAVVNIRAKDGTTAILDAAENSKEITLLLVEKGADVNVKTADGKTPLSLAGSSNPEITEILKKAGAK